MNERLQEYVDSRGLQMHIDRDRGLIRGVKILGLESRNQRTYLPAALRDAMRLYDGAKVNVNHAKGHALAPRDYQDRIGVIRGVRFEDAAGLFGDLHFNPKHSLAEQLAWDAEHAPENVGLSHNVEARTTQRDGRTIVESIAMVHSVDLVSDPATTSGLFEESQPQSHRGEVGGDDASWSHMTLDALRVHRPDLIETLVGEQRRVVSQLREALDQLQTTAQLDSRRRYISRLLVEHGLPDVPDANTSDGILSREFIESLFCAPDDEAVRLRIVERATLVRNARHWRPETTAACAGHPRSRDQRFVDAGLAARSVDQFVRAIT